MENKNWKNLSVIQTIKSNMGILAGLVILCVVLSLQPAVLQQLQTYLM